MPKDHFVFSTAETTWNRDNTYSNNEAYSRHCHDAIYRDQSPSQDPPFSGVLERQTGDSRNSCQTRDSSCSIKRCGLTARSFPFSSAPHREQGHSKSDWADVVSVDISQVKPLPDPPSDTGGSGLLDDVEVEVGGRSWANRSFQTP